MRIKMQVACMPWGEIQGFNVWRDFHGDAGSSRPSRFAPGGKVDCADFVLTSLNMKDVNIHGFKADG